MLKRVPWYKQLICFFLGHIEVSKERNNNHSYALVVQADRLEVSIGDQKIGYIKYLPCKRCGFYIEKWADVSDKDFDLLREIIE